MLKLAEADESIAESHSPTVRVADLHVDLAGAVVMRDGRSLPVNGRSFQLLRALIERYPQIASHRELIGEVWKGRVVTADALSQRVRLLRRALGDERGDQGYIVSIHGQGYRLAHAPRAVEARSPARRTRGDRRWAPWLTLAAAAAVVVWLTTRDAAHAIKHLVRHLLM